MRIRSRLTVRPARLVDRPARLADRPARRARRRAAAVPGVAVLAGLAGSATLAAAVTGPPAGARGADATRTVVVRADGPGSYINPVIEPSFADPSVLYDPASRRYYAYGTEDQWTSSPSSLHIMPIFESSDLVHWSFVRDTFRPASASPVAGEAVQPAWTGTGGLWAPEVHEIDGRFVMYYTASAIAAGGGSAIGVATASSPAGPFTDSGGPLVAPRADPSGGDYWTYDPDEIETSAGTRYLYFGSFVGGLWVVQLSADGLSLAPGASPVQVAASGRYEGTFVVQHDGWYYLFASSGNCCAGPNTGYDEVVARSRSVSGPFDDALGVPLLDGGGSVVLAADGDQWTGTGGVSLVTTPGGRDWIAFHAVDESDAYLPDGATRRPMLVEPVRWQRDGWPVVNGGYGAVPGPQPAPGSAGAAAGTTPAGARGDVMSLQQVVTPGALMTAYSQDFDTTTLGSQWSFLNEDSATWSLSSDPGTLTIEAEPGLFYETEHTGQNVLLERAPRGDFVAETKLALDPTQNYQQAGLVLWQNDDTWMKVVGESNSGIDLTEWGKETDVTSPDAGFSCGSAYPADTCPVYGSGYLEVPGFNPAAAVAGGDGTWDWLRIAKVGDLVTAYTSTDGTTWTPGATYNLSGFEPGEPLEIGLLATGAGAPAVIPAHFAYVHVYTVAGRR